MRSVLLVLAAAFLCASCHDATGPTVLFDQQFVLAPGETGHIANTQIRIGFDGVDGDSRCPANALCIQGGDALVKIRVLEGDQATPYVLHTGDMKPVSHQQITIALVDLSPYPFTFSPIDKKDYRVTLKATN